VNLPDINEIKSTRDVVRALEYAEAAVDRIMDRENVLSAQVWAEGGKAWARLKGFHEHLRRFEALIVRLHARHGKMTKSVPRSSKTRRNRGYAYPASADLGLSREQRRRNEALADMDESGELDQYIGEQTVSEKPITVKGALRWKAEQIDTSKSHRQRRKDAGKDPFDAAGRKAGPSAPPEVQHAAHYPVASTVQQDVRKAVDTLRLALGDRRFAAELDDGKNVLCNTAELQEDLGVAAEFFLVAREAIASRPIPEFERETPVLKVVE